MADIEAIMSICRAYVGSVDAVLGRVWRPVGHFGDQGWEPLDVRKKSGKHRKFDQKSLRPT